MIKAAYKRRLNGVKDMQSVNTKTHISNLHQSNPPNLPKRVTKYLKTKSTVMTFEIWLF